MSFDHQSPVESRSVAFEDGPPAASSEEGPPAGAAAGGDPRALLVTMADKSSTTATNRHERRVGTDRAQALIRETCGDLPEAKRISKCGRVPTGRFRPRVKRTENGAFMSGLQTCGSVWGCLRCSYKVGRKRTTDINHCVASHINAGGGVLHVVVTMPHRPDEALDELWSILSDCWQHVTSGGGWKKLKERHDVLGYVRATEVTHSWGSGWHPHCHVLLFVGAPMSPIENEDAYCALRRAIRQRWTKRMGEKHGRTMSTEFGIRVDPVKADEADGSGQYLTKVGYELAMADSKIGRSEGQRHPFAIAHDAASYGDKADAMLLREWVVGSKRKKSVHWSGDQVKAYVADDIDKTDTELAQEEQVGDESLLVVERDLWQRLISRTDGARSDFLQLFEDGGDTFDALYFLAELGITAEIAEDGPLAMLRLNHHITINVREDTKQ